MKNKRILYITSIWTAIKPIIFEGKTEVNGMPGFWRPLEALIKKGYQVDMIFYDEEEKYQKQDFNIRSPLFKKVNILTYLHVPKLSGWRKMFSNFNAYFKLKKVVETTLKQQKYDFVYGQGPLSEVANRFCRKNNIPFGMRRYGDTLLSLIEQKGKLYAKLSRPIDYISMLTPKDFMLATNDGSKVDELYQLLNGSKQPYPLYFWINGVNDPPISEQTVELPKEPFLFYTARIVRSKRQDKAIELLAKLKEQNIQIKLLLAGSKDEESFYLELTKLIAKYDLANQVEFLGSKTQAELFQLADAALASLAFYDDTNFGNCFIEYMKAGGCVISLDDGSLDKVLKNNYNGFLVKDMSEAAEIVKKLYHDPVLVNQIKQAAKQTADQTFYTWEERIEKEIDLIEEYI